MNAFEQSYRKTAFYLGVCLLVFEGIFCVGLSVGQLFSLTRPLFATEAQFLLAASLLDGVWYVLEFVSPVLLYRLLTRGERTLPVATAPLPRKTPLYLLAGLAVITAMAYCNAWLLSLLPVADSTAEVVTMTNSDILLQLLLSVAIPAFVEELLFRGLVLTALLPYGRGSAILVSAVLFGLMHQSPAQLLYATVAGLVLGYLYVKSRSIFLPLLLHFVNNFINLLFDVLLARLPYATAGGILLAVRLLLLASGLCAFLLLWRDKKAGGDDALPTAGPRLSPGRRARLLCSFPMIVYAVLTLGLTVVSLVTMLIP